MLQGVSDEENEILLRHESDRISSEITSSPTKLTYQIDTVSSSNVLLGDGAADGASCLSTRDTAKLSLEFCALWFGANYFVSACLEYTTVASSTILTSTSSMWTLLFGAMFGVEEFTFKKLLGVSSSLAGIILTSGIDFSSDSDHNRGSFPHKTGVQLAIGDALALFSAVIYGVYTIVMKKRIRDESRVNMPLFFGFIGIFNLVLLWPGFFLLHVTGVETFELPPTRRILSIVIVRIPPYRFPFLV